MITLRQFALELQCRIFPMARLTVSKMLTRTPLIARLQVAKDCDLFICLCSTVYLGASETYKIVFCSQQDKGRNFEEQPDYTQSEITVYSLLRNCSNVQRQSGRKAKRVSATDHQIALSADVFALARSEVTTKRLDGLQRQQQ